MKKDKTPVKNAIKEHTRKEVCRYSELGGVSGITSQSTGVLGGELLLVLCVEDIGWLSTLDFIMEDCTLKLFFRAAVVRDSCC